MFNPWRPPSSLCSDVIFGRHKGGITASRMGYAHADKLIGIHVNLLAVRRDGGLLSDPTPDERKYLDELAYWLKEETGYQWISGHAPADAQIWSNQFACRTRGVDRREVSGMV